MKKITTLFAVAALGAALIGCGSSGDTASTDAAKPADAAATTTTTTAPAAETTK